MGLLNEIDNLFAKEFDISVSEYRYVNVAGKYLYIEGHKGILLLSDDEMVFKLKRKNLSVNGTDLQIKLFENSTAVVSGNIINVKVI